MEERHELLLRGRAPRGRGRLERVPGDVIMMGQHPRRRPACAASPRPAPSRRTRLPEDALVLLLEVCHGVGAARVRHVRQPALDAQAQVVADGLCRCGRAKGDGRCWLVMREAGFATFACRAPAACNPPPTHTHTHIATPAAPCCTSPPTCRGTARWAGPRPAAQSTSPAQSGRGQTPGSWKTLGKARPG